MRILAGFSQVEAEYIAGHLFVKVESGYDLPEYSNKVSPVHKRSNISAPFPHPLQNLIEKYHISEIDQAFSIEDEGLNRVYLFSFNETEKGNELIEELRALPFIEYAESRSGKSLCN